MSLADAKCNDAHPFNGCLIGQFESLGRTFGRYADGPSTRKEVLMKSGRFGIHLVLMR